MVTRGGGSLEDLWAFNEEIVCRAIYRSRIPVISAIGHEIDVTLSDLVADAVRALTPSEAAERVAPAAEEIAAQLAHYGRRRWERCGAAGLGPAALAALATHRLFRRPYERVQLEARRLDELQAAADRAAGNRVFGHGEAIASLAGQLESLSPLAVLGRGYSLTRRAEGGPAIRDAQDTLRRRSAARPVSPAEKPSARCRKSLLLPLPPGDGRGEARTPRQSLSGWSAGFRCLFGGSGATGASSGGLPAPNCRKWSRHFWPQPSAAWAAGRPACSCNSGPPC